MIKQKQLFRHNPPETCGDCQRTVIACILDQAPEEIPNFGIHYEDGAQFKKALDEYLATRGLFLISFAYDISLEELQAYMKIAHPGVYYMLTGTSANGTHHVVIGLDDKIHWDPAIDDSGIVGPCNTGYYWIEFLVPTFTKAGL